MLFFLKNIFMDAVEEMAKTKNAIIAPIQNSPVFPDWTNWEAKEYLKMLELGNFLISPSEKRPYYSTPRVYLNQALLNM